MESSLGHPLYLHPIEQSGTYIYNSKDELITRSGAPLPNDGNLLANDNDAKTRGSKYNGTDWSAAFGVSAVLTNNNTYSSYFQNQKATPSGGSWLTNNPQYWPTAGSLSFYAYAPYCDDSHSMLSENATVDVANAKTVHYVASANDVEHQPDLIVANHLDVTHGSTEAPNSVSLNFSHVLTAITFAVGSDMVPGTVKSIAIKGVRNEGDFDLAANTWNAASLQGNADFVIPLGNNGQGLAVTGKQDEALTTSAQTLMMIPQNFGANSTAKVEIVFTKNGTDHKLSAPLRSTQWDAGSTIIYKVSTSSLQPVLATVTATYPTDWSGQKEYANKLKSAYVKDDKLGLYVVSQDGKVKAANEPVTFNGTSWTLANQSIRFNASDHFFAYSPYTTDTKLLQGMPTATTTVTADKLASSHAFFQSLENAWPIQSDQSTRANFDASDLLVSKDAHSNNTGSGIDITMAHAMGLADITLGQGLNYELSDKKYSWTSAIVSDKFVDKKPYGVSYNRYVAVVKPNVPTTFNATASGWKCAWKSPLSFNLTASASIDKKIASRTDESNHPYTLALGDIHYTNGAVTHQTDDLEPAGANTPIGIVGYIAKGGDDYWVEKNTGSGHGGHALVMCVLEPGAQAPPAPGSIYYWWGPKIDCGRAKVTTSEQIKTSGDKPYGSGFLETNALIAKLGMSYAAGGAKGYNTLVAPADKSTGWFLPTAGQFYAMFSQFSDNGELQPTNWTLFQFFDNSPAISTKISKALSKVGEHNYVSFFTQLDYNWTSTESTVISGIGIDTGMDNGMALGTFRFSYNTNGAGGVKSETAPIRPFLAF